MKSEEEIREQVDYYKKVIDNYHISLREGTIDKETASFAIEMYDNMLASLLWVLGER